MMKTIIMIISFIFILFISFPLNSSVAQAARLFPGGAENWYVTSMNNLERPSHPPPAYPKPAPPERYPLASAYFDNWYVASIMRDGENDDNLERPRHPPPSYPKPAPPRRDVAASDGRFSMYSII